ncbi:MAG: PQQ-dependent sugar dehydrogenase, partial [Pseudomonadota bacterium]
MNLLAKLAVAAFLSISTIAWSQIPPDVTLDTVPGVSGLSSALSLKHAGDDSGRLFIVEQGGTVRVVAANGTLLPTPFISLGNLVTTNRSERGLLDLAFHPEFAANGLFYLHYSAGTNRPEGTNLGDTIVAEFSVSTGNPDVANSAPEEIVLAVRQDWPNVGNHNGGGMNFGPDGYLYLGLGDGGS